jgi:hypothetical protein
MDSKKIHICGILYENWLRDLCSFFCKSNCALSHSNTGLLEQNTIPQQITQMQQPASLALPKLVTTGKGTDEVDCTP